MSDEPKKQSRAWIAWTLIALFVLYPLSIGPTLWLVGIALPRNGAQAWRTAFAPIFWGCNCSDTLSDLLNSYIVWWVNLIPD
jgi:hypothetical protein